MECHDILGITETATIQEISKAYIQKENTLSASSGTVSAEVYDTKRKELQKAKEDCLFWLDASNTEKMKLRIQEASTHVKHSARLNSYCFGPCTFTDVCCGSACEGTPLETSCCEEYIGSQAVPIVCDVIIWLPLAIYIIVPVFQTLFGAISNAVRTRAENRRQQIRLQINNLRTQLIAEEQQRATFEKQLKEENDKLSFVTNFSVFYLGMGVSCTSSVIVQQHRNVNELESRIQCCRSKENALREEMLQLEQRL